jgi:hypothetical protein
MSNLLKCLVISFAANMAVTACGVNTSASDAQAAPEATAQVAEATTVNANIDALSWLAGDWGAATAGTQTEVHYTAPASGTILGVIRVTAGEQVAFFEFQRLVEQDGTIVLNPSPNGIPGVAFKLAELSGTRAVFRNPEHDFPREIAFSIDAEDQLHMRVAGTQNGQAVEQEFAMARK